MKHGVVQMRHINSHLSALLLYMFSPCGIFPIVVVNKFSEPKSV